MQGGVLLFLVIVVVGYQQVLVVVVGYFVNVVYQFGEEFVVQVRQYYVYCIGVVVVQVVGGGVWGVMQLCGYFQYKLVDWFGDIFMFVQCVGNCGYGDLGFVCDVFDCDSCFVYEVVFYGLDLLVLVWNVSVFIQVCKQFVR